MSSPMDVNKVCLIVCWFGKLPEYLPVWLKSCGSNPEFDFLLLTDDESAQGFPGNVKRMPFSGDAFLRRARERLDKRPNLKAAYRLCDYRPMYGVIFREELRAYRYWGYCDVDVVFGSLSKFLPPDEIERYDAVFNGGHFTVVKNSEEMNQLFMRPGALFDYRMVIRRHAIFAFDETTGLQRIARANNVNARFGIPYIETESKYRQLRSRMEKANPDYQAYYWENGALVRVKAEGEKVFIQEVAYIHLQKRKLRLIDPDVANGQAFWITPEGYAKKERLGIPTRQEIEQYNPFEGSAALSAQASAYRRSKIMSMLKRNPFQLYVRFMQQKAGINAGDGAREEMPWTEMG